MKFFFVQEFNNEPSVLFDLLHSPGFIHANPITVYAIVKKLRNISKRIQKEYVYYECRPCIHYILVFRLRVVLLSQLSVEREKEKKNELASENEKSAPRENWGLRRCAFSLAVFSRCQCVFFFSFDEQAGKEGLLVV